MAPKEVASLQDLAQRHGGSLTTNPDTGLPEAGFLESLLPMALGAGAMMLPGMQGVGAGYIGAGIGALQGLRTGSLKQGLMAGLGAYGGASMAGGLLGSGAMSADSLTEANQLQLAQTNAANKALTAEAQQVAAQEAARLSAKIAQQQADTLLANQSGKSFMDSLSSNFSTAGDGLSRGFGNFSNSVGMVPGSIGLKTALGAAAIPLAMSAYEDGNSGVPVQKTNDADLGAYAKSGAKFYPNYVGPYESNVRGGEYTYARPYYGAEGGAVGMADGGVTGMAMGGVPQRDAYQEYMDYYNNSFPSLSKETVTTVAPFQYPTPATPAPAAPAATMPFLEAPISSNTGRGGVPVKEPGFFDGMSEADQARHFAYNPVASTIGQAINRGLKAPVSSVGLIARLFGGENFDADMDRKFGVLQGYDPGPPVEKGYTRVSPVDPFRRNIKEQDIYQAENERAALLAGLAANYPNTPPPGTPAPVARAMPEGIGASNPTPQGDPRQMQEAAQAAREASAQASLAPGAGSGGGGGNRDGGIGGSNPGDPGRGGGGAHLAQGGISSLNQYNLGSYSDGGRLLKGPGDGVSDSIPATIGKGQPARLADGEFVIPARIVSEIGNGSTEAGARKLYAMMDRIQKGRRKTVGRGKVAVNSRADRHLPA
jgi:hypothetical protein